MAKKVISHNGRKPSGSGEIPEPDNRTGDVVPDVRVVWAEHEGGRHIRICTRRGGAPVALTPAEAQALASQIMDVAGQRR
jgi:hypothetical protein